MIELYMLFCWIIAFPLAGFFTTKCLIKPDKGEEWVACFCISILLGIVSPAIPILFVIATPFFFLFLAFKVSMTYLVRKSEDYTSQFSIKKKV